MGNEESSEEEETEGRKEGGREGKKEGGTEKGKGGIRESENFTCAMEYNLLNPRRHYNSTAIGTFLGLHIQPQNGAPRSSVLIGPFVR